MTNTPLVPVFTGIISNQSIQLCNARDLHAALKVETRFNDWLSRRIGNQAPTRIENVSKIADLYGAANHIRKGQVWG